jgi:hypothetical protein
MNEPLLVGDRDERYELAITSRRPIYVRPGIHPDPDPKSQFESIVDMIFASHNRLSGVVAVLAVLAIIFAIVHGAFVHAGAL